MTHLFRRPTRLSHEQMRWLHRSPFQSLSGLTTVAALCGSSIPSSHYLSSIIQENGVLQGQFYSSKHPKYDHCGMNKHSANFLQQSLPLSSTRLAFKNHDEEITTNPQVRSFTTSQQPKLAHEWVVDGQVLSTNDAVQDDKDVVIFLHGLLGNGKNLRTPAKKLTERLPHISALIMDIRGHGNSSSPFHPPHNFQTCTQDIFDTLHPLGLTGSRSPTAVIGHSLGGRLALQYSHVLSTNSSSLAVHPPKQTWVLDAVPGMPDPSVHSVLKTISSIPLPIASKSWLSETLTKDHKMNKGVAMWIASNLKEIEHHHHEQPQTEYQQKRKQRKPLEWVFNLDIANELIHNFSDQEFVPMIHDITTQSASSVNFVVAGRNKEWKQEIVSELQSIQTFGTSPESLFQMHTLPKAGHWVHVDDLDGLVDVMVNGLERCA